MATQVLSSVADVWPAGTTVSVYPRPTSVWDGSGVPPGSVVTTAAVASDGSVTFAGLADNTAYVAYAASRSRSFRTPVVSAESSVQAISAVVYGDARFPDQPTSVTEGGVTTTYTYNADGTYATETRGGVTRTFAYNGSGALTGATVA